MAENPYIMSLVTQTGVIITAVLGFVTVLIQTHTNKKTRQNDKILLELKEQIEKDINAKLEENEKNNKAQKEATIAMLRSQIVSKCETYQREKYLPEYARYCLTDLFKQYTALGGNHGVNVLVDEVLKLPAIKIEK